jgi:hypothetical protein
VVLGLRGKTTAGIGLRLTTMPGWYEPPRRICFFFSPLPGVWPRIHGDRSLEEMEGGRMAARTSGVAVVVATVEDGTRPIRPG